MGLPVHMKSHTADGSDCLYDGFGREGASPGYGSWACWQRNSQCQRSYAVCVVEHTNEWICHVFGGTRCLLLSPHLSGAHAVYEGHTAYVMFTPFMWVALGFTTVYEGCTVCMGLISFMRVTLSVWGFWGSHCLHWGLHCFWACAVYMGFPLSTCESHCMWGFISVMDTTNCMGSADCGAWGDSSCVRTQCTSANTYQQPALR